MAYAMILKGGSSVDLDVITASASDILSGKVTVDVEGEAVTGTMPNNGAVTKSLAAGESYTITKGFHDGSGKVTANSLASQTSGTATAADIVSGKTAWVGGNKLTGTKVNPVWTGWKQICKHENVSVNMDTDREYSYDLGADLAKYNTFIFRVVETTGTSSGTKGTYTTQHTFVCTRKADDTSKHTITPDKTSNAYDDCVYRDVEYSVGVTSDCTTCEVSLCYDGDSETTTRYAWFEVVLIAAMNL